MIINSVDQPIELGAYCEISKVSSIPPCLFRMIYMCENAHLDIIGAAVLEAT